MIFLAKLMSIFLSTFTNKIDKKGRVSIPSSYRVILAAENFSGVIAYPSFVNKCVEACGMKRIEKISESIDQMDPFSNERDSFAASVLGGSEQLSMDKEGRITLSENLIDVAELSDKAVFIGKGQTFEIWNESNFKEYSANARKVAKENRGQLSIGKIKEIS